MEGPTQVEAHHRQEAEPLLGAIARRTRGDRQLAEDVAQESWLRAVLFWPAHGAPDNPGAWLRTVSRNLLINEWRRPRTTGLDQVAEGALQLPDGSAAVDAAEQHAVLHAAIAELPADARQLLEAHYFAEQSFAEIGRRHSLSERAVEGRLRRIRIQLRAVLEARGITGAELRGVAPALDFSLLTVGKALLMTALIPWLMMLAFYFVARRVASGRSDRQRSIAMLVGGLGLIALGTLEAPDVRALQLFGLGCVVYAGWKLWRMPQAEAPV